MQETKFCCSIFFKNLSSDGKTSTNANEEAAPLGSEVTTAEANPQALQVPEAQPNQQFPVPYFAADGMGSLSEFDVLLLLSLLLLFLVSSPSLLLL